MVEYSYTIAYILLFSSVLEVVVSRPCAGGWNEDRRQRACILINVGVEERLHPEEHATSSV